MDIRRLIAWSNHMGNHLVGLHRLGASRIDVCRWLGRSATYIRHAEDDEGMFTLEGISKELTISSSEQMIIVDGVMPRIDHDQDNLEDLIANLDHTPYAAWETSTVEATPLDPLNEDTPRRILEMAVFNSRDLESQPGGTMDLRTVVEVVGLSETALRSLIRTIQLAAGNHVIPRGEMDAQVARPATHRNQITEMDTEDLTRFVVIASATRRDQDYLADALLGATLRANELGLRSILVDQASLTANYMGNSVRVDMHTVAGEETPRKDVPARSGVVPTSTFNRTRRRRRSP